MSSIKFYYAPGACSLAPHILLHETGLHFSAISMRGSEARTAIPEAYRKINPKMQVPAITLDETDTITENPAVATVISNTVPEMGLMGRTPLETAKVYEWMNWLSGSLHSGGFGHLFRPQRWTVTEDEAAFEGIKKKAREVIEDCFERIEEKLNGVYAVGDALTAVDPYLFVFYRWGNAAGFEMRERWPKYTKLVENLVKRPAVKAALKAENIESTL